MTSDSIPFNRRHELEVCRITPELIVEACSRSIADSEGFDFDFGNGSSATQEGDRTWCRFPIPLAGPGQNCGSPASP